MYGQHWALCRKATRGINHVASFNVRIGRRGASWGIQMVANDLILTLSGGSFNAFEGLSAESSWFPTIERGRWDSSDDVRLED